MMIRIILIDIRLRIRHHLPLLSFKAYKKIPRTGRKIDSIDNKALWSNAIIYFKCHQLSMVFEIKGPTPQVLPLLSR